MSRLGSARPSQLDSAYHALHRLVALACLLIGLFYWVRLLGIYPGSLWRFDLMPVEWQVVSVILAVIYPFASVGLWLVAPWGAVIWCLCAGAELVMHGFLQDTFGSNYLLIGFHLLVAASYAALRFLRYREERSAVH
ncbi:DUF6163 family protein [Nitratireductor sp. GISD-1A_MAKvit]|uniref:DUF6163 family protein n=1 Tax=Nitratireductor sp. GISD-1A_MAKvit TaxID=3234198 RepID=UPI00346721F2